MQMLRLNLLFSLGAAYGFSGANPATDSTANASGDSEDGDVGGFGPSVVGGVQAKKSKHPSVVMLELGDGLCGGAIINENWVLTAAHCTHGVKAKDSKVRYGSVNVKEARTRRVMKIIDHPSYVYDANADGVESNNHDISLLKLAAPIERIASYVLPTPDLCLPGSQHPSQHPHNGCVLVQVHETLGHEDAFRHGVRPRRWLGRQQKLADQRRLDETGCTWPGVAQGVRGRSRGVRQRR